MFKEKDYIVYKRNVCKIDSFYETKDGKKYYNLIPIDDSGLKIKLPIDNKNIRKIISKKEIEKIIKSIKDIDIIDEPNKKLLEYQYKELLMNGDYKSLVKIIKTTYLRNKERINNNKKTSDMDEYYFKEAERILYNEFSVALNMNYNETKDYIISEVDKL